jgi:prephenate dehydrogenase
MPRQALIVGLGLIGGSAGLRLQQCGWRVRYIDPHVDAAPFERAPEIDDDSTVVLATPIDEAVRILRQMKPRRGAITSVSSVMTPLRDAGGERFVAGHPMAGSEESGFAAARADLFDGRTWFLDGEDADVEALVRDCGARAERVEAAEHDAAVALTSHLPQVLSSALAAHLADHEELLRFAGSGLKTFLRLAGSDAAVWKPVLEANRGNITEHAEAVSGIVRAMLSGDPTEGFAKAQRVWRKL